jgi:biopolymer transport protein ExbD
MSWRVRHQGSPRSIEGLSVQQVADGLQDGLWESTDEVMGPNDPTWTPIESHPQFSEIALDLEPEPARHTEDETRLDMNPLIDVCLVLLIFFILTTSYAALQRILDMPASSSKDKNAPLVRTKSEVQQFTIMVQARMDNGKPVILVENEQVEPDNLATAIKRFVRDTRKTELALDAASDVDWETVVRIQDAARGAGVNRVHYLVPRGEAQ